MPRPRDPAARLVLLEKAARMLTDREPIALRSLVAGTGMSTMAVYTHFGGVDGLWRALRQEGFARLADRFAQVPSTEDAVQDLSALVASYILTALEQPDVYRVMFDATIELEDLPAADATLEYLVQAVRRGQHTGRLSDAVVPLDLAIQCWMVAHGLASLVANGPLPGDTLRYGPAMLVALLQSAGDEPARCSVSVLKGWGPDVPGSSSSSPRA